METALKLRAASVCQALLTMFGSVFCISARHQDSFLRRDEKGQHSFSSGRGISTTGDVTSDATALAWGLSCLGNNLDCAVPPIPNSTVGVDMILCYLMYLDCINSLEKGLSHTFNLYTDIDILKVNTRRPQKNCLVLDLLGFICFLCYN